MDKAHKTGPNIQGKFDLWAYPVVYDADWKPEEPKQPPKRAIMDLGAKTSATSYWDTTNWMNPRLDSRTGFHNAPGKGD